MKLLLFSDLHADTAAAKQLAALAGRVDILVGAGDFGNVHRHIDACLDILCAIGKPCVLVAGNNETTAELREACRDWPNVWVLHGSHVVIAETTFYGVGGGIPVTPFGSWSYDFTEEQAEDLLAACPNHCVLVSHSPPKGAADVSSSGKSLGSMAVCAAVERTHPRLVVCGHIHASAGRVDAIGATPVINAGPNGIEWSLDVSK